MVVREKKTTPACRRIVTIAASCAATRSRLAQYAPLTLAPARPTCSLRLQGKPWRGPIGLPCRARWSSSSCARWRADSGSSSVRQLVCRDRPSQLAATRWSYMSLVFKERTVRGLKKVDHDRVMASGQDIGSDSSGGSGDLKVRQAGASRDLQTSKTRQTACHGLQAHRVSGTKVEPGKGSKGCGGGDTESRMLCQPGGADAEMKEELA